MCVRECLFMFFKCDELLAIASETDWNMDKWDEQASESTRKGEKEKEKNTESIEIPLSISSEWFFLLWRKSIPVWALFSSSFSFSISLCSVASTTNTPPKPSASFWYSDFFVVLYFSHYYSDYQLNFWCQIKINRHLKINLFLFSFFIFVAQVVASMESMITASQCKTWKKWFCEYEIKKMRKCSCSIWKK